MTRVALLGFFLSAVVSAQTASELPETYVVQPSDTCMDIAKKFFGSASEYPRLHEHNDMGPLPHHLKPGTVVRLRAATQDKAKSAASKSDAVLTAFSSTVNTRGAKISEWKPAERNQPLFRLDEVHTLSHASADILFRDHSTLQMKQNALIVIYGGSSSKVRSSKAGGVKLLHGELGVALADLRKPPVAIDTPSTEISARATQAIVDVDLQQTSRVSVQQGEAKITAQGKSVYIKSGQGVRVKKDAPPEPPMQLPAPPAWGDSKTHQLYVAHGTNKVAAKLQWTQLKSPPPTPSPQSPPPPTPSPPALYRVEVAKDFAFQNRVSEETTDTLEFSLAALPPGTSYVRLRTINETGLISSPSPVKRLDVLKIDAADSATQQTFDAENSTPKTAGQVPFNLTLPEDIQVYVHGELVPLVSIQQPGEYLVEFKTMDGQQSVRTEVEATPPKFSLEIQPNEAGEPELWLRFETAIAEDAALNARGLNGTEVGTLSRQDNQTFKATVSGHRPYQVDVLWGDYLLGSVQQDITPPSPPPPPMPPPAQLAWEEPVFPEQVQRTAVLRERRLGSLALPSIYLPKDFQLNANLDIDFSKRVATSMRLAARVDGPFKQGSYFANLTLVNFIGKTESLVHPELAVGAQMQFPLKKLLAKTPPPPSSAPPAGHWTVWGAADFSGNLNIHRQRQETLLRLRAMGTFGYQANAFSVSTAQGIALEYANSLRAAWIGSISTLWHIWPKFLLAAQLDGQKTAGRGFASAAAVGFRLLVGPVEIGLTGHAGLTSEGRSQWGEYGMGLNLGIR